MANKMPFQGLTAFGAAGSAFGSTVQVTCPASNPVYLATSSQTILQGVLPAWCYVTLSATGSGNVAFQMDSTGAGTTYTTWAGLSTSATLLYLDGTGGQRCLNANAAPVAVLITPIKQ